MFFPVFLELTSLFGTHTHTHTHIHTHTQTAGESPIGPLGGDFDEEDEDEEISNYDYPRKGGDRGGGDGGRGKGRGGERGGENL